MADATILLSGIAQALQTGIFEQPHMSGHIEDAETLVGAVRDYVLHCPHVIEGTVVRNIGLMLGSAAAIIRTSDKWNGENFDGPLIPSIGPRPVPPSWRTQQKEKEPLTGERLQIPAFCAIRIASAVMA